MPLIYPLAVDLLARDLAPEVRAALRTLLYRIGVVSGFIRCVRVYGRIADLEAKARTSARRRMWRVWLLQRTIRLRLVHS